MQMTTVLACKTGLVKIIPDHTHYAKSNFHYLMIFTPIN